jgi:hypothetical protein
VRNERRKALSPLGLLIPFLFGGLTFCSVVLVLWILNQIVPYLPWIPKGHPLEPVIKTAWLCARFATAAMLFVWVALFIFMPKIDRAATGDAPIASSKPADVKPEHPSPPHLP